jgi:hypothetical protein
MSSSRHYHCPAHRRILHGQGKHTKLASAATTMAISGGAVWPSVVYAVVKASLSRSYVDQQGTRSVRLLRAGEIV